jgi:hypothetical protein
MHSVRVLILGLAVAGAACSPDNRHPDLAACVAQAQRDAPQAKGQSVEEAHDAQGDEVRDCMKTAGYRHDMAGEKCEDDVDFNADCYVKR